MAFIAAAILGSAAISGGVGIGASIYGANQQSQALGNATSAIQQGQSNALKAIQSNLAPFVKYSQGEQPLLSSLLTPGQNQTQTLSQLPGFQFAKDIAMEGVAAGAGRTGISGTTAVQGGTLGTELASQNWTNYLQPLLSLYGQGAGAAGQAAGAASNVYTGGAQSLGQLAVGQGNVQAGMASGIAGAAGGALGSVGNLALLSKLTGSNIFGGSWGNNNQVPYEQTGGP